MKLESGKRVYFASDFHLGAPSWEESRRREQRIVSWLEFVRPTAQHIFLMGDLFDFWFEYKTVIPKGFIRFQGKLAELTDSGVPITIFTGNHDIWMFGYFTQELGISIFRNPKTIQIQNKKFHIGHGDGLGPGDRIYKILKRIFENKLGQFLFEKLHPNLGIGIAHAWSNRSRKNHKAEAEQFLGDDEWLWQYCQSVHEHTPHDYYIFGHRHLPLELKVGSNGHYLNLGEWITQNTYAEYDGIRLELKKYTESQMS